ncbi:CARDB domain-containing protein [Haloprofundus salilacus]|uniref:CARDB domain-containing protein n=1 Tax=Haloprofundus salilacus TaxID=2876190 RepID=UPI001CCC568D|nr:CARDB domain-containing protein [Haloprofundus salilacus]
MRKQVSVLLVVLLVLVTAPAAAAPGDGNGNAPLGDHLTVTVDGDRALDAGESGQINVTVKNTGKQTVETVKIVVHNADEELGVEDGSTLRVQNLSGGSETTMPISIDAAEGATADGEYDLTITVEDGDGDIHDVTSTTVDVEYDVCIDPEAGFWDKWGENCENQWFDWF